MLFDDCLKNVFCIVVRACWVVGVCVRTVEEPVQMAFRHIPLVDVEAVWGQLRLRYETRPMSFTGGGTGVFV